MKDSVHSAPKGQIQIHCCPPRKTWNRGSTRTWNSPKQAQHEELCHPKIVFYLAKKRDLGTGSANSNEKCVLVCPFWGNSAQREFSWSNYHPHRYNPLRGTMILGQGGWFSSSQLWVIPFLDRLAVSGLCKWDQFLENIVLSQRLCFHFQPKWFTCCSFGCECSWTLSVKR